MSGAVQFFNQLQEDDAEVMKSFEDERVVLMAREIVEEEKKVA